jgi:hypothetical protein
MKMRSLILVPPFFLISCGSGQPDKPMTWEDSVIKNTNVKIEKLDRSGDSIEHVNAAGTRTLK